MAWPSISKYFSGKISGPPSIGLPIPLKIRPTISSDTGNSSGRPVKRTLAFSRLIPLEPSNSCTIALSSCTSKTCPWRLVPSWSWISTSSLKCTPSTCSTIIKGPTTSLTVRYSLITFIVRSSLCKNLMQFFPNSGIQTANRFQLILWDKFRAGNLISQLHSTVHNLSKIGT